MAYQQISELPQDVQEKLPEDAQHIFLTAYNSILENNNNEETAARVAWETIEKDDNYFRDENGKWKRITQYDGGNNGALGTMPNS